MYRQYWGRGEYFQARAMEVAGYLAPARESVEHAFHTINDDGEWDGPPVSGWPAWDLSLIHILKIDAEKAPTEGCL